jgi:hypothetical protein
MGRGDSRKLAEFLSKEGLLLLPMLELIEQAEMTMDELSDVMGRATVEAVLLMSAQQVAGLRRPGKKGGEVRWHGSQAGVVSLSERKLRVCKPRLRKKGKGNGLEVPVPAYDAMVLRWAAVSFIDAEKAFRRIMGYQDLWMLKANLDELDDNIRLDNSKKVA